MNIFDSIPHYLDLNEPNFDKANKVHDWRNHVTSDFIDIWDNLSLREKQIIYIMAEQQANKEEWD